MDIQLKTMAATLVPVEGDESDSGPGSLHVIASSPKRDRDGETLWADEWEQPLPDHVQIIGDHKNNEILSTVGSGVPTLESDNKIHVRGSYADTTYAQEVRKLVNGKHLRHLSAAFRDSKSYDGKQKAFAEMVVKELSNMTQADRLQAIHDMSFNLGAQCFNAIETGDVKDAGMPLVQKYYEGLAKMGYEVILKRDGNVIEVKEFPQAPEAPPQGADPTADQAEEDTAALDKLKAAVMSMQTRHLIDEGELDHA
jgi:hypothetical protein